MVTTKKIPIKYIQEEMWKELKHLLQKLAKHQRRQESKKWGTHCYGAWREQRVQCQSESCSVSNYSTCQWIAFSRKKTELEEWRKTHNPTLCCLQETHFKSKDTNTWTVKGWKRLHTSSNRRKAGVAVPRSVQTHFKKHGSDFNV